MFEGETSPGVYGDGGRELYVGGLKAYVYKCSCLGHSRSFSTVWHEILRVLIFCDFCVFSAIHKNKLPQLKIAARHFPAKNYSGVNILRLKFTTQKYSTKKSYLFNYNLSLSFRNKAVYDEILTHTVVLAQKICISIARTQ